MRIPNVLFSGGEPLPESEARSLVVHDAIDDALVEHVEAQWTTLKRGLAAGAVAVLAGVGLLLADVPAAGGGLLALGLLVAGGTYYRVTSRDLDVSVDGVQKGYWTGHLVPDEDGTVVFDATESVPDTEFRVDLLPDAERPNEVKRRLDEIDEFPVLLDEDRDVEAAFLDALDDVERAIDGAETHEIRAPIVPDDDPAVESLSRLATRASAETVPAGGVSVSAEEASEQVDSLSEFEDMVDEDRGESTLLDVGEQSRELASELSGLQETTIDLLNDHIGTAGDYFGLVTYNFYCPDCMDDDIESRLEPVDDEWYCDTCRSHYEQGVGVPRHRIRDELVLDISDQLWVEKDDQLREIYENIEDQKTELEEREFEQRREEIRSVGDRIKDIRGRIRDLRTEAKAKQETIDRIGSLMVKYERLAERKKEQFKQDVRETFAEIEEETERVVEETRNVVEGRIEEAEKEAKEKAETMREEQRAFEREKIAYQEAQKERRHQEKMAQADQHAKAELAQQEEHHREDRLLETEGEIHAFDTVNAMRDKKGEIMGRSKYEG